MDQSPSPRTPICRLTTAEALIVWAIRHWVQSVKARLDPRDLLRRGFDRVDAPDMTDAVDEMLTITLHEATTVLDVGCVRCPSLGDGARDFLRTLALAQRGRRDAAVEVLETWLPPSAARLSYEQAAAIGRSLGKSDLQLPLRTDTAAEVWWMDLGVSHHEGSALVH